METISTVDELKTLIKEKVLPAYEKAYADENADFEALEMDFGICWYCHKIFKVYVCDIFDEILETDFIAPTIFDKATKEDSILPRIEWMRKIINS